MRCCNRKLWMTCNSKIFLYLYANFAHSHNKWLSSYEYKFWKWWNSFIHFVKIQSSIRDNTAMLSLEEPLLLKLFHEWEWFCKNALAKQKCRATIELLDWDFKLLKRMSWFCMIFSFDQKWMNEMNSVRKDLQSLLREMDQISDWL